jgi:hypothetical protein
VKTPITTVVLVTFARHCSEHESGHPGGWPPGFVPAGPPPVPLPATRQKTVRVARLRVRGASRGCGASQPTDNFSHDRFSHPWSGHASADPVRHRVGILFGTTAVCMRLGLDTATSGLVLATVAISASLLLPLRYAAPLGLVAWAFLTGFIVNLGGQLSFAGDDAPRAAVLVLAAAFASLAARVSDRRQLLADSTDAMPEAPAPHGVVKNDKALVRVVSRVPSSR